VGSTFFQTDQFHNGEWQNQSNSLGDVSGVNYENCFITKH